MSGERNPREWLREKCIECGIDPELFWREKALELEERKRILLTPTKSWFSNNASKYHEFVARMLRRELTDSEKYDRDRGLFSLASRRLGYKASPESIDLSVRRLLLQESKDRCAVCGHPLTTDTMQVDHKIPLAEGGSNHTLNLQALCVECNQGKRDYFEDTAQAAARPWYEQTRTLVQGKVKLSPVKRFCVLRRDESTCRDCGARASEAALKVAPRVPQQYGGQLVYDNLLTLCTACCSG